MLKLKPTQLKGKFKKRNFFEGWFHKIYSAKHQTSFVIIYGYTTGNSYDKFGFIQFLIPNKNVEIYYFSKNEISYNPKNHSVQMGSNILSLKEIKINLKDIYMDLNLSDNLPISSFKNSMGYAYFIPTLPCYHSVLNKSHLISGEINLFNNNYLLDNDLGYMEKNWGTSFPEKYFWIQAVEPHNPNVSLLFSQAEIKWMGKSFIKHVGHLRINGEELDLRTLTLFNVSYNNTIPENITITIKSKQIKLEMRFSVAKKYMFKGPLKGKLSRDILHHSDSQIDLKIYQNAEMKMYKLIGNFEMIGGLKLNF
jgi:tocopherol cyclase